jgi:hypothetical protein
MKRTANIAKAFLVLAIMTLTYSCELETEDVKQKFEILESINENTILDATKIYVAESAVQVHGILTIPAGTIIKFKPATRIDVHTDGAIVAQGTSAKPIIFTSIKDDLIGGDTNEDEAASAPAPKDWGCITNWSDNSIFTHCHFFYGGGFGDHTATLDIINCQSIVTYCTFGYNYGGKLDDNTSGALSLNEADIESTVNNNTFYGNDIPLTIDVNFSLDSTNVFHKPDNVSLKNKYNGVFVIHSANNNNVLWQENEVPFVICYHMGIESTSTLTLRPDVVIKMYPATRIDLKNGGTFNHNGAIITSFKDDACLGDTNGDGTLTTPSVGDWVGINLGYGNYLTGSNIKYATH